MTCTSILMAHLFIASKHMQEAAAGCILKKKSGGGDRKKVGAVRWKSRRQWMTARQEKHSNGWQREFWGTVVLQLL